jgi:hypothetical protein
VSFARAAGSAPGRLLVILLLAALGYLTARLAGVRDLSHSGFYLYAATLLLAVGLYGSTHDISPMDARRNARTVIGAVTLGVLGKAVLISAATFLLFRQPVYLVLGVAVAQIDPLSVAAMAGRSAMSDRAKAILAAWASFDDPVTVVLTIYAATFALKVLSGRAGGAYGVSAAGGVLGYAANIGANVAFAVVAAAICALIPAARERGRRYSAVPLRAARTQQVLAVGALAGLAAIAVWRFWLLGVALIGLFFRPAVIARWLDRVVRAAFVLATFALGLLLGQGIDVLHGVTLGAVAFVAQAVVSLAFARDLPTSDRVRLALGQQNGITAIILALLLQPLFPQAIAIVGPAVLAINAANIATNSVWDHRRRVRGWLRPVLAACRGVGQRSGESAVVAGPGAVERCPVNSTAQAVERVPRVGAT